MKTKMKGNNKGFSLVELIVVMAIMAILAVTLAPRLSHYIDKAREASDQQAVATIYDAVRLAYAQYPEGYKAATTGVTSTDTWALKSATADSSLYSVSTNGKDWTISSTYVTSKAGNDFVSELNKILKSFKLQSKNCGADTQITVTITDNKVSVSLDYDGTPATGTNLAPYTITE